MQHRTPGWIISLVLIGCWLALPLLSSLKGPGSQRAQYNLRVLFRTLDKELPKASTIHYVEWSHRNDFGTYIRLELAPRIFYQDTALLADTVLLELPPQYNIEYLQSQWRILWDGAANDCRFLLLKKISSKS
ncbi:MAG: hypothetical protein JST06_09180 [Bacteroidetes bacterium]|nr:hypothetical protein [Bacteroidota bacterium]MBS1630633.1 hypothetical protein [Bacteroidota bacterium]